MLFRGNLTGMTLAENIALQNAVAKLPAELQDVACLWADRLHENNSVLPAQDHALEVLLNLVASSDFAARVLLTELFSCSR